LLAALSQPPDRSAELGLNAVGLLKAVLEQQLREGPVLRTAGGGEVRLQPRRELFVVGQRGHIDQLLNARNGRLVKGCDPTSESVGEAFNLTVRDEPVHVTVFSGQAGWDVITSEQDLQGAATANQASKARHRAPSGDGADTDLELAQYCF